MTKIHREWQFIWGLPWHFCHRWWKSHEITAMQSIGKKVGFWLSEMCFRTVFLAFFGMWFWCLPKQGFFKAYFGAFKHVGFAMFHSSKCGLGNLSSRGQSLEWVSKERKNENFGQYTIHHYTWYIYSNAWFQYRYPSGNKYMYIYIPRTQMTLVLVRKGLVLRGWPSKIEVSWVLGTYIIYI